MNFGKNIQMASLILDNENIQLDALATKIIIIGIISITS
jgi:hypothetical protein